MSEHVLLIEPDPTLAKYIASLLERSGYVCRWATSVDEALADVGPGSYSLIILDLDEAAAAHWNVVSRARAASPGLRVIGLDSVPERSAAIPPPKLLDAVIPKPFLADPLLAALPAIPST